MRSQRIPMDKFAIAAALQEIAARLDLKGGDYFKARAFKIGARVVAELTEDLGKLIKENRLTFLKGIGHTLAKQISELYATGESSFLNKLRAELPAGILELANVPGLNVKKVERLQEALGISSIDELKAACEAGKLRHVKGFGAKTEQKVLEAITSRDQREQRIHIHHALRAGERLLEHLETAPGFVKGELAGSLRRWKETASQIIIIAGAKQSEALIEYVLGFPLIVRVEEKTPRHCSVVLTEGFKAKVFVVKPAEYPGALLRATGSDAHLKKLDEVAASQKLKLTKSGVEKLTRSHTRNQTSAGAIRVSFSTPLLVNLSFWLAATSSSFFKCAS